MSPVSEVVDTYLERQSRFLAVDYLLARLEDSWYLIEFRLVHAGYTGARRQIEHSQGDLSQDKGNGRHRNVDVHPRQRLDVG